MLLRLLRLPPPVRFLILLVGHTAAWLLVCVLVIAVTDDPTFNAARLMGYVIAYAVPIGTVWHALRLNARARALGGR